MASHPHGPGDERERGRAHRVGSGADAHPWADVIGEIRFLDEHIHVELPEQPHAATQRLLAFLGVTWEVHVRTPTPLAAKLQAEAAAVAATKAPKQPSRPHAGRTGSLLAAELRQDEQDRTDLQPMTARCGIDRCDWSHVGTAGDGREAARMHRESAHPEVRSLTRDERKTREIAEARKRRADRDAAASTQQPAERVEGEPDATEATPPAAQAAPDRVDAAATASSPSPIKLDTYTREAIIAAIRDHAADHDGWSPGVDPKRGVGRRLYQAARYRKLDWRELCAEAGAKVGEQGAGRTAPPDQTLRSRAEPSRAEPSRALAPSPARREPIRAADIPYDIWKLEDEAAFLRERANALEQIATGLRRLQELTTVKETP